MATATRYDIGDQPRATVTFRDADDVLTSPGTLVGLLRLPDGTESSLAAPTTVSTGVHRWTLPTLTQSGLHVVRCKGTAGLIAAVETSFVVDATAFVAP